MSLNSSIKIKYIEFKFKILAQRDYQVYILAKLERSSNSNIIQNFHIIEK